MSPDRVESSPARCPRCGTFLAPGLDGLCAACLLAAAQLGDLESGGALTRTAWPGRAAVGRLRPGQRFGPYRIERLLGRGGMGEVYAAEYVEHGRRVAIKILAGWSVSAADRGRFLREGQLAATVNHPNSVYIFGSEEVEGAQVIVMELVAGGTLKDRVEREGPMPPAAAVDAVLQVINGLDAAQAAGILHRDIKPSNCFVDVDGTVKIGDFGLSIPTLARGVAAGPDTAFQGTPAFASPEQLRGEPLDVRSDIYSVGVTLYYLLTGIPPFDAPDLMALAARVAADVPPSPADQAPQVPPGLAGLVLSCLAKDPERRPGSYAVLARALRPFSSATPRPAPLGRRVAAGAIDFALLSVPLQIALALAFVRASPTADAIATFAAVQPAIDVAYFGLLEGVWRRSVGKYLLGLRIAGSGSRSAGGGRVLARAVVFPGLADLVSLTLLQAWVLTPVDLASTGAGLLLTALLLSFVFVTARSRNGFAGLHDLITGTRVVDDPIRSQADRVKPTAQSPATFTGPSSFGPYEITGRLGSTLDGDVLLAFDRLLGRRVWIQRQPPGAGNVTAARRDLARRGRLRWLGGGQTDAGSWEAWEAPGGTALTAVIATPQPWRVVKQWLIDLAEEGVAARNDQHPPVHALDHLWISGDGRLMWLDFPAPSTADGATERPAVAESLPAFLADVALRTLGGEHPAGAGARAALDRPLPLHARRYIEDLLDARCARPDDLLRATRALADRPTEVSRRTRALHLGLPVLGSAAFVLSTVLGLVIFPEAMGVSAPIGPLRLARHAGLQFIGVFERAALFSLVAAGVWRGGAFLKPLGLAVVDTRGRPVSRARGFLRALIAWSPLLMAMAAAAMLPRPLIRPIGLFGVLTTTPVAQLELRLFVIGLCLLAGLIMLIAALARPDRSVQDRLAGTWLVPR